MGPVSLDHRNQTHVPELVSLGVGEGVPDNGSDVVADGLTDGVSELAVGVALPVVGLADSDGVTVAVAVVVTSAVWVAVAVVVTVTIGVGVTAGVAGVEALDVG